MTIGLQGTWSVSVKSKDASWAQRFVIAGADSGDGTYTGSTSTPAVLTSGAQWGITVEHDPSGPASWGPSRMRIANPRVDGAFFKIDIESDDGGGLPGDEDFNDLVLTAAKPLNAGEWTVYGTVKTYSGLCLFNPCFPFPWVVIDTPLQLERLLRYNDMREMLERIYGSDIGSRIDRDDFRPMMLSRGGSSGGGFQVSGTTRLELAKGRSKKASVETVEEAKLAIATRQQYAANLTAADAAIIDRIGVLWPCSSETLGSTMLRFAEYDRTDAELGGGPYTGFGDRELLGSSATDEFGNYVFSFTRDVSDLIDESISDTPTGGDPTVSANPDLLIQFPDEDGVIGYETAPYYDIPNVREINLCIRKDLLTPKACQGGRVLQYVGDIPLVPNPGTTLHADGTVSNNPALSGSGPSVTRAAWNGGIDLFGCFESSQAPVAHYTIEYRVEGAGSWEYVNVDASGLRQQGNGLYVLESYGPDTTVLPGGVPAYRNIELEPNWSTEVEHRKARLRLIDLLNTVSLPRKVADVWLRIRGYDSANSFVAGTYDIIRLQVDEERATGDIASILVPGSPGFDACALLELPSDATPLEVKLRALDPDGFLSSWSLRAIKGSNTAVGLLDTATAAAPAGSFPGEIVDNLYVGTAERTIADIDGYVTLSIVPVGGAWLGEEEFCAYSFELVVQDRTTNGVTSAGTRKVHDEVVGMKAPELPGAP